MPPRPTLVEALHSKEFEAMLPRLVAYAARRLRRIGWAEGEDRRPAGAQAEELVADAVEAALAGKRVWPDDMDLETFLMGIMWSQVEHRYAKEKRSRRTARAVDAIEERSAASDVIHRRRELCAAIERELEPDPDLYALYQAMASGAEKPADRAAMLGWTTEREKITRERMNRRLAAAELRLEPGDVGQEALPGGRWIRPPGDVS